MERIVRFFEGSTKTAILDLNSGKLSTFDEVGQLTNWASWKDYVKEVQQSKPETGSEQDTLDQLMLTLGEYQIEKPAEVAEQKKATKKAAVKATTPEQTKTEVKEKTEVKTNTAKPTTKAAATKTAPAKTNGKPAAKTAPAKKAIVTAIPKASEIFNADPKKLFVMGGDAKLKSLLLRVSKGEVASSHIPKEALERSNEMAFLQSEKYKPLVSVIRKAAKERGLNVKI